MRSTDIYCQLHGSEVAVRVVRPTDATHRVVSGECDECAAAGEYAITRVYVESGDGWPSDAALIGKAAREYRDDNHGEHCADCGREDCGGPVEHDRQAAADDHADQQSDEDRGR